MVSAHSGNVSPNVENVEMRRIGREPETGTKAECEFGNAVYMRDRIGSGPGNGTSRMRSQAAVFCDCFR